MKKTKSIIKEDKIHGWNEPQQALIREQLKRRLMGDKYKENFWLEILQTHKIQRIQQSEPFRETVKNFQDLKCSVCLQLMIFPVALECGHYFCRPCIEQAALLQNRCPLCRAQNHLQYFSVCQKVNEIILTISFQELSNQEKLRYQKRYNDFIIWEHLITIDPEIKIKQTVHFFDQEAKGWRYGEIARVIVRAKTQLYFVVIPLHNLADEDRQVQFQFHYLSRRIAKCYFFYRALTFKQEWKDKSKEKSFSIHRDQHIKEVIQRRIKDKTIRNKSEIVLLFQTLDLTEGRSIDGWDLFTNCAAISNYTFEDFHNENYIVEQTNPFRFPRPSPQSRHPLSLPISYRLSMDPRQNTFSYNL